MPHRFLARLHNASSFVLMMKYDMIANALLKRFWIFYLWMSFLISLCSALYMLYSHLISIKLGVKIVLTDKLQDNFFSYNFLIVWLSYLLWFKLESRIPGFTPLALKKCNILCLLYAITSVKYVKQILRYVKGTLYNTGYCIWAWFISYCLCTN